jgi:Rps23 Pro-64 3,4-dihydroxylase Tpa1-like proline 4-hydroxylase
MNFHNITKSLNNPFPHIVIDNFLDEAQYKKILNEILEVDKKYNINSVMGGRYQYSIDLFDENCHTKKLFDFFNSGLTYKKIQNLFINIPKNDTSENSEYLIDEKKFTHFLKKKNILQNILKRLFPKFFKKKLFLHMDFSVAKNNYFRDPHHDKNTRIISFLLYLNTIDNNQGGSLKLYKFKKNQKYERFPSYDKIEFVKKIEPKGGRLVIFLSCPNSIHEVEMFKPKNDDKRIFAYGSYTSFFDVNWTNNE